MTKATQKHNEAKWSDIKTALINYEKDNLMTLVKDLFDASAGNKMFLSARLDVENRQKMFREYRRKIFQAFFPNTEEPQDPQLEVAQELINNYKKATNDIIGTLHLIIAYVENSIKFSNEYGYYEDSLIDSVDSILEQFKELLSKNPEYIESITDEFINLHKLADKAEYFMFEELISYAMDDLNISKTKEI